MNIVWTLLFVLAVIVEAITVDLVSIWFGIGALCALICNILHLNITIQIGVAIVVSIVCIIVTRPIAKKYLKTNIVKTNLDRVIGKEALVTKTITSDSFGEVKVLGKYWSASSLNHDIIESNEYVEVLSIEGAHLVVRKI